MEVLDVEVRTLALLIFVANLFPNALTNLVRRCLTWPTEVTVHFEVDELRAHVDVLAHEVEGIVEVPHAGAVKVLLAKVHTNVEHHAGGTHALTIEHA